MELKFENEFGEICDDLLHSEQYIKEFHSIVSNSTYSVYALSGGWGTGKTCFIKMWENLLNEEKQAYIHIDSFKMDYESEPFLMLIKAFKDYMIETNIDNNKREGFLNKAKNILSVDKMLKLGFNIIIDKTIGSEPVKEFLGNAYTSCFDKLTADVSLYDDLKISLEKILENQKSLYIIIDELDRCRPDFTLETLERIKHIFHIKNVKYILVYNENIMKSIINKRYGIDINTDRYLHKFVDKTYLLDNTKRINHWFINEVENSKENLNSFIIDDFLKDYSTTILTIAKKYDLKLRDL
jgi:Cdc6-like AAA superfamily ATPase